MPFFRCDLAGTWVHDEEMKWYGTATLGRIRKLHSTPDCAWLHLNRRNPVVELDDTAFRVSKLCKVCCSGQVRSLHVRCRECGHQVLRPCPHNGGVMIQGKTGLRWAWPEDALSGTLVHPMHTL
jgi:hypothetical protein